jgi:1-deoxy-D-xylulose-5-phosphate reductoisomerase
MTLEREATSRRLILLGSTGSIGTSTLEVVGHLRRVGSAIFDVVGLAAGNNAALLSKQAAQFGVQQVAVADPAATGELSGVQRVYAGPDAALQLIEHAAQPGDLVVGAMVGSAGVPATIAAIERGCDIALANKETLVAAGSLVMPLAKARGVNILPVDSEHNAIFQCLDSNTSHDREEAVGVGASRFPYSRGSLRALARIIITASGGPFRTWPKERIDAATVKEALNHPTWSMGPKVTIDSASLMNKALEVIEAHWLFDLPSEKIDVLVHPQSLIHGLVEFVDGSVLAQLGAPDMKAPIQYALTWPRRLDACAKRVDFESLRRMDFEPIDHDRFGSVKLAYRVIETGGTAGAIFNAANEEAVKAFIDERIAFGRIIPLVHDSLDAIKPQPVRILDDVFAADRAAREHVREAIEASTSLASRA